MSVYTLLSWQEVTTREGEEERRGFHTVSFWSLVPITYARCSFATVAKIQVLSVGMDLVMIGGDTPTSQTWIDS